MSMGDINIPPVNMGQAMVVMASAVGSLIGSFAKPEDSEEDKVTASLVGLAIFLHQLTAHAKHKDKVADILAAVREELLEPSK